MPSSGGFDRRAERKGLVAGAVVGLEALDGDAEVAEPCVGALPEPDRGDGFLVGQDFAVGNAAVTVDRGVDERVADSDAAGLGDVAATPGSPATACGDAAQLLDVHLDQLAGTVMFDAAADHGAGGTVEPAELVEALAAQDP